MAGSFYHLMKNGRFSFDTIENMGDAYECAEECFWLIHYFSKGDVSAIKRAISEMYKNNCDVSKLSPYIKQKD